MKIIKKILYHILGKKTYFRTISKTFIILFSAGILKLSDKFRLHYFVKKLIREGDTIIDIGANMGYFSFIFAGASGKQGVVWCIEPVSVYRNILISNTKKFDNVKVIPYALGESDSSTIMGIEKKQSFRHGLTHVLEKEEHTNTVLKYKVELRTPDSLFGNLKSVQYIKCDIEGYEDKVIPGFMNIISRDKPVIQIEVSDNNHDKIYDMLINIGYTSYILTKKGLLKNESVNRSKWDLIYIHNNRVKEFESLLY